MTQQVATEGRVSADTPTLAPAHRITWFTPDRPVEGTVHVRPLGVYPCERCGWMPINHTCTCNRPWPLRELEALHARHQAAVARATGETAA